ncbi:HD domain-containing protein [Desulfobulbus rhabdoformis]|uniref:HD-GYP domain-containing protein n=1 Tax=Desulfobulbus rhabdoformis TaxID=34032 RepID=UPI0019658891|nr:HD domain-containing phosphohydrolase [Desulfobulbus rhabdoformis]MBM9615578.1 HD domain-containing protein [Desulfobulbus rhabdoformis]
MTSDPKFQQEVQQLHHKRVYFILLVGMGIMFLFAVLDYLLLPEQFTEFLRYRLAAVVIVGLLLAANYCDRSLQKAWMIGITGYLFAGIIVLLTVLRMGGVNSPYYVGVIVVITSYTALAPLSIGQTLVSGFALVFLYLFAIAMIGPLRLYEILSLFSNLFFMICFVFIAATQSWADSTARKREFLLRHEENLASEKLTRQAKYLEQEVQRRTQEQQATEHHFRILYEAIVDDVILVHADGTVLQANQHAVDHYFGGTLPEAASVFDLALAHDRPRLERELLAPLAQGATISAWRITLRNSDASQTEVEISGALLQRAEKKLGIQLVLRDISIRQQLEQKLIGSLNRVRKMENAAILALAKLSEYRDVTPGNHLERIREYCRLLASELAQDPRYSTTLTPNFIQDLYQGAILHDIGMVAVPDDILTKKHGLSPQEEAQLRQHTRRGGDVIKNMMEGIQNSGFLAVAQNIAYFHHERWDGRGYPQGLRGSEIPLEARIMAVADAYEEHTAPLDLNARLSHAQTVQMIGDEIGRQFDPAVVDVFLKTQDTFLLVSQTMAEPDPCLCMESGDCNLRDQ